MRLSHHRLLLCLPTLLHCQGPNPLCHCCLMLRDFTSELQMQRVQRLAVSQFFQTCQTFPNIWWFGLVRHGLVQLFAYLSYHIMSPRARRTAVNGHRLTMLWWSFQWFWPKKTLRFSPFSDGKTLQDCWGQKERSRIKKRVLSSQSNTSLTGNHP